MASQAGGPRGGTRGSGAGGDKEALAFPPPPREGPLQVYMINVIVIVIVIVMVMPVMMVMTAVQIASNSRRISSHLTLCAQGGAGVRYVHLTHMHICT